MKATHSGTCQLCGRFQKLPGDKLSKHGYNVQWGFFSGVCPGADELPLEISCHLIKGQIASQKASIEAMKINAAATRTMTAEVWVHEYKPATWERGNRHSSYVWRKMPADKLSYPSWRQVRWENQFKDHNGRQARGETRVEAENHADAVLELNGKKADDTLKMIAQREEYVAWLEKTVAEWQPKPLKAVA